MLYIYNIYLYIYLFIYYIYIYCHWSNLKVSFLKLVIIAQFLETVRLFSGVETVTYRGAAADPRSPLCNAKPIQQITVDGSLSSVYVRRLLPTPQN